MKLAHLKTMAWLRWRLMANQLSRTGKVNRVLTWLVLVLGLIVSVSSFFLAWFASSSLFEKATPDILLLVWTGFAMAFLFAWSIGVFTDLQRSEPLSLDKFLHLPMSPVGAFAMNFIGSFISISMVMMFPVMLGTAFGMMSFYGWSMWLAVPLLLGFILLIVAATYQLRGWLAAIMVNKRHRRAIITGLTVLIIVLSQLPNLLNMTVFSEREKLRDKRKAEVYAQQKEWENQLELEQITEEEFETRVTKVKEDRKAERKREREEVAGWVRIGDTIAPPGWMPLGIEQLARNRFAVPVLCFLGLAGLSIVSLRRSWLTTMRMYRGDLNLAKPAVKQVDTETGPYQPGFLGRLVDKKIPLLSEHQSAIATTMMASVARAPEAKLAILAPFIVMVLIGGSFLYRDSSTMAMDLRSLTALGVISFAMFGVLQMIQNQFGYDRAGFRCLVLSPIRRRDILFGKNAALFPAALLIGSIGIVALQVFLPMRLTHLIATFFQLGTVYLLTCMIGNLLSIYAPLPVASGSMKPLNMKLGVVMLQLLITLLLPIGMIPMMAPLGVEYVLREFYSIENIPFYLILAVLVFACTLFVYLKVVSRQGEMLNDREKQILETVTQVGT